MVEHDAHLEPGSTRAGARALELPQEGGASSATPPIFGPSIISAGSRAAKTTCCKKS
jgi:hypothetical protein